MAGSIGQPTQAWFPFAAVKAATTWSVRNQVSNELAMGEWQASGSQNSAWSIDTWLDSVTWKVAMVLQKDATYGIHTIQFNGTTQGTIDGYNASTSSDNYTEITGLAVSTPAVTTVQTLIATKNASSSNYNAVQNSFALIATSGAYSTPSGTDTPGYTWEWIPWMGNKINSANLNYRAQKSGDLGGGVLENTTSGNTSDYVSTDCWLDSGTFTYTQVYEQATDSCIYTLDLDGSTVGTIDGYGVSAANTVGPVANIALTAKTSPRAFRISSPTKNASSSTYNARIQSCKWIRTGA